MSKNENNFVGGAMTGVPVPEKKATGTGTAPTDDKGASGHRVWRSPYRGRETAVTPSTPFSTVKREPLDLTAEILYYHGDVRPVELHKDAAWEATQGINRRFQVGDYLRLAMRASLNDDYIEQFNDKEFLSAVAANLPTRVAGSKMAPVPYLDSFITDVQVIEHVPNTTVTIGLAEMYVVEVVSGPAKGLKMLRFASEVMDHDDVDGFGNKRIDQLNKRKEAV